MNYPKNKSKKLVGVLLLSYGGPSSLDEIEPFLKSITGLPQVPENYYKMVREKYEIIGGRSPFKEITAAQADSLQEALGSNFIVTHGFRHSHPSIKHAIDKLLSSRVNIILGLCMTPHYSTLSCGDYIKTAKNYLNEVAPEINYFFIDSWHNNIDYINLLAERIKKTLSELSTKRSCILFTAHSLPVERLPSDDPYLMQLKETIDLTVRKITPTIEHRLAFQSRRPGKERWLEPDIHDEIDKIKLKGFEAVVVVPLSFVSDHLETLYDIDIVLKEHSSDSGIHQIRIASFNTAPDFINVLRKIISNFMNGKNL